MNKLLGKPLAWLASLGTGALTSLIFWLLAQVGIQEARTSALIFPVIVTVVAKFVGWLVSTYGPKPLPLVTATPRRRTRATGYQPPKMRSARSEPGGDLHPPSDPNE